jgi:hypothetical protein
MSGAEICGTGLAATWAGPRSVSGSRRGSHRMMTGWFRRSIHDSHRCHFSRSVTNRRRSLHPPWQRSTYISTTSTSLPVWAPSPSALDGGTYVFARPVAWHQDAQILSQTSMADGQSIYSRAAFIGLRRGKKVPDICEVYDLVCSMLYLYRMEKYFVSVHTYIRTSVHTYIRTYVHTYIRTYVHTYIQTDIHTYIHIYIYTYIYIRNQDQVAAYTASKAQEKTYSKLSESDGRRYGAGHFPSWGRKLTLMENGRCLSDMGYPVIMMKSWF